MSIKSVAFYDKHKDNIDKRIKFMDIKDIVIIIHHTLLSIANYLWAVTRCNSFMPQQVVVKCVHAVRDNSLKLFPKLQQDLRNIYKATI